MDVQRNEFKQCSCYYNFVHSFFPFKYERTKWLWNCCTINYFKIVVSCIRINKFELFDDYCIATSFSFPCYVHWFAFFFFNPYSSWCIFFQKYYAFSLDIFRKKVKIKRRGTAHTQVFVEIVHAQQPLVQCMYVCIHTSFLEWEAFHVYKWNLPFSFHLICV